jgi:RNA polymerase sigma factor (sigma-70 family)
MRPAMTAAFPGDHEAGIRVLGEARPRRGVPARLLRLASDERLVAGVRDGSEAAFEAIFDRYHRGVLGFCRHMLGSVEEAEDAVQHTFLSAYRELAGSAKPVVLRPWLYTIARNRCLTMLRGRVRLSSSELVEPPTEHLAAAVERRHDLRDLLRDLAGLPEEQRSALVLSEIGDMSHDDIADVLGCRRDKVKALVFQARSSLIASRQARETPCAEIREQLANLHGGALRRNELRRHVSACAGCREFRDQVRAQRRDLALVLPVAPSIGLKTGVIGAALGSSAAGPVVATGGAASGTLAAKVLVAAAIAGGGTVAVEQVSDDGDRPARTPAPAEARPKPVHQSSPGSAATPIAPSVTPLRGAPAPRPGEKVAPSGNTPTRKRAAPPPAAEHPGNSGNAPGHAKDPVAAPGPGNSAGAPGHDAAGPGNSENAAGHSGRSAGRGNSANAPGHLKAKGQGKPPKPAKPANDPKPDKVATSGKAAKPVKPPKPPKPLKPSKALEQVTAPAPAAPVRDGEPGKK